MKIPKTGRKKNIENVFVIRSMILNVYMLPTSFLKGNFVSYSYLPLSLSFSELLSLSISLSLFLSPPSRHRHMMMLKDETERQSRVQNCSKKEKKKKKWRNVLRSMIKNRVEWRKKRNCSIYSYNRSSTSCVCIFNWETSSPLRHLFRLCRCRWSVGLESLFFAFKRFQQFVGCCVTRDKVRREVSEARRNSLTVGNLTRKEMKH